MHSSLLNYQFEESIFNNSTFSRKDFKEIDFSFNRIPAPLEKLRFTKFLFPRNTSSTI